MPKSRHSRLYYKTTTEKNCGKSYKQEEEEVEEEPATAAAAGRKGKTTQ